MTTKEFQERSLLRIFLSYFKPHRRLFALDMTCAFLIALVDLAFPLVSRKMCIRDRQQIDAEGAAQQVRVHGGGGQCAGGGCRRAPGHSGAENSAVQQAVFPVVQQAHGRRGQEVQ